MVRSSGKKIPATNAPSRWKTVSEEQRYRESFFFYFMKPIEEILEKECTPFTQLVVDLQVWDECDEMMNRYYNPDETKIRLRNYTKSYAEVYDSYTPNVCIVRCFPFMVKRAQRIRKLAIREGEIQSNIENQRASYSAILPMLLKKQRYLSINDF